MSSSNGKAIEPVLEVELDRPRKMRMDFNTIIRIDEALGVNLLTDEVDIKKMSVSKLRQFVWAFLVDDDPELTVEQVGRLLHPGTIGKVLEAIPKLQAVAVGKVRQQQEAQQEQEDTAVEETSTG